VELADFSRCETFRQAGDDLECERIGGEQLVNSRQALSGIDDALGTGRYRLGAKLDQILVADKHLYFAPGAAPLVVADTAHDARKESQNRYVGWPFTRAVEGTRNRLMQHVGPVDAGRKSSRPEPSQRLEAHQIGIRQRLNGACDVDGRVVDRDDAPAAPLGEMFHSKDYAPDLARRGQGTTIFFAVRARLNRAHFIIEMTGKDD